MELYLIRHGETVDNVAGLYAGVRDSALTNHGHEQTQRLGVYFAKNGTIFTHIFASPLSRAQKTALAIHSAQLSNLQEQDHAAKDTNIVLVPDLVEQDFGSYEGKSFHSRSDAKRKGRDQLKMGPEFVDVESKASMNQRADAFLNQHLLPLLGNEGEQNRKIVAIVSHGLLLSQLWRRLLSRLPPKSVTVASEIMAVRGSVILEHLGGWSNTGYLELSLYREPKAIAFARSSSVGNENPDEAQYLTGWSALIRAVDRKDHLVGLERQRGGIGRSAHDDGQKKLDSFFKRQRTSKGND